MSPHMARRGMFWKCLGKNAEATEQTGQHVVDSTAVGHTRRRLRSGVESLARQKMMCQEMYRSAGNVAEIRMFWTAWLSEPPNTDEFALMSRFGTLQVDYIA